MPKKHQITCETGLKKNILAKEVFDREMALCKKLHKEHKGKCAWGECKKCGVIPLLYKLHKGKLLEKPLEINKAKSSVLK
ncbi:MAG: hypothetical protein PHW31_00380 [Candidatus Pacebacteria bacterium]|nr:hypothetical protein [Candidatus Paceibacterota bacterium]